MSVHQCPKCELRFVWPTELDEHCRTEHPDFHHDYPVHGVYHYAAAEPSAETHASAQEPDG